jgi:hypothetical protein
MRPVENVEGDQETNQQINGACRALIQGDYTHRHKQMANIVHEELIFKYGL